MHTYTEDELFKIVSQTETKDKVIQTICNDAKPASQNLGIFMAGSPGAGKTESAQSIKQELEKSYHSSKKTITLADIIHLEQDKIKTMIPGYTGKNAPLYQRPASRLLASVYKHILKHNLSFIHDTTLSNYQMAEQNIQQAIKHKYIVLLYFVYQEPQNAWHLVKKREAVEKRVVPKESFIHQFINSQQVANQIKSHFGNQINLNIIIKDINKETGRATEKFLINKDNIDSYVPKRYTEDEISYLIKDI